VKKGVQLPDAYVLSSFMWLSRYELSRSMKAGGSLCGARGQLKEKTVRRTPWFA